MGPERTLESLLEEHERWTRETGGDRSVSTSLMSTLSRSLVTLLTAKKMPPLTSSLCRRLLKLYGSCEFAPLLTTENGQSSRVLERIPIPVLHTVKLGPTNHLVSAL